MNETIYLAGGCFWGVEAYFKSIYGVLETTVGYANGTTENPTYQDVCFAGTNHAETVKIVFDTEKLPLELLLLHLIQIIDPYSINHQGGDFGPQYRTGVYSENKETLERMKEIFKALSERPYAIEVEPLQNFYPAEAYHQDYLKKNPLGYCHVVLADALKPIVPKLLYQPETYPLTLQEAKVAYKNATDVPHTHPYTSLFEAGIYVDKRSGEPLFFSKDKFECGCGWPSFSAPIDPDVILEQTDTSFGMVRTEVKARVSGIHLGHVFPDGPKERGGIRYCINGSVLQFIPKEELQAKGYAYLEPFI
ncbi:peptide-methionine (S)-S-oxide reductase MsrA [Guggenheimella bovis]